MPSKYARRPPTHSVTPWCLPPPKAPGVRVALLPTFIKAQVVFRQSPAPGMPKTLAFYFPVIRILSDGTGLASATNSGYTCQLSFSYDVTRTKLTAAATCDDIAGPVAALQSMQLLLAHANPLEQTWIWGLPVIPFGQTGSIKAWE
jgi:hypothetical protein